MKKFFVALSVFFVVAFCGFSQDLKKQSVVNTLWTGFGLPAGDPSNSDRDEFRWVGIIDTLQARLDHKAFTIDGALSWGAFTNWTGKPFDSFTVENTPRTQFVFLSENRSRNSYHLNFIARPTTGLDLGMGTALSWSMGPVPYSEGGAWKPKSHVLQADFTNAKDSGLANGKNVYGYVNYGNKFADNSLGARYSYKDIFQVGLGIDSGSNAKRFDVNVGLMVKPVDWLLLAAVYQNCFLEGGDLYTGVTLNFNENFKVDAWGAINGLGYENDDSRKIWGTGAAVFIKFGDLPLWIRPEVGFSDYTYSDYTNAFYVGGRVNWDITKTLHLGAWSSMGWGAKNKNWNSDWDGGFVFNVRPDFTFDINKEHSLTAVMEYEQKKAPDGSDENKMFFGLFWVFDHAF